MDVLKENADALATNDDTKFDGDLMLMTGEIAKLLEDLPILRGGEKNF